MRERIADVVTALRDRGVRVSVAEAIDAVEAAAAVALERGLLAEALAATLVKDERDRPLFDEVFDRVFPARVAPAPAVGRRGRRAGGEREAVAGRASGLGEGGGAARTSEHRRESPVSATSSTAAERRAGVARDESAARPERRKTRPDAEPRDADLARGREHHQDRSRRRGPGMSHDRPPDAPSAGSADPARDRLERLRRERELRERAFRAMTPQQIEEARPIVRELARRFRACIRRRLEPRTRGRLDFRRTLRAAVPRGGVPFERFHRGRRRDPPALVALCDLSGSVAIASDVLLSVLASAAACFSSARFYGFVDRLVEIEFVDDQVRPAAPIYLMARSDFGRVLADFAAGPAADLTMNTVVLVLGDARNNRRPPRADVLAAVRARVRRVLWLNPDPRERWDTGDSVIGLYGRHVDAVLPAATLVELERALADVGRG